jgi:hypothetical protein
VLAGWPQMADDMGLDHSPVFFRNGPSRRRVQSRLAAACLVASDLRRRGRKVFVGDDQRWDVVSVQRVGLRPILLSPDGVTRDTPYMVISRPDAVLVSIHATRGPFGAA